MSNIRSMVLTVGLVVFFTLFLSTPTRSFGGVFDTGQSFSELVTAYDSETAGKKNVVELQSFKAGMYIGFVYGVYEALINNGNVYPLDSGIERSREVLICVPPNDSFEGPLSAVSKYFRRLSPKQIRDTEPYGHVIGALFEAYRCSPPRPAKKVPGR